MTPEPTPLVTVLPCEADIAAAKACWNALADAGDDWHALSVDDQMTLLDAFARHAASARLAALEAAAKVDRETIIEFIKLAYVTGFNDGWADGNGEGDAVNTVCRGDGLGDFLSGVSSNDAIRALSNKRGEGSEAEDDWLPIADAWKYGDAKLIVTDGQAVHGAAWWHSREQAWLDCDGIVPTLFQPLPKPPASNKRGRDGE